MADDAVRSVAIAAEGSAFSAGGDLRQMRHLAASPAPAAHGWPGAIVELHHLALQAPKPLVALVDGPAYAGGFGLAGICDIVLATPRASFALPEVRIGLFPMIVVAHLARSLPRKVLLEMMMTGQPLSVDDAYRLGFVARICTDTEALHAEADRYASWFADAAPDAIRLGRRAFAVLADLPAPQALDAAQLFNLAFFLGDELPRGPGVPGEAASGVGGRRWLRPTSSRRVRTPVGKRGGALSGVHPADLGATVIEALLARTGADPDAVDDVVWGCVGQMGPQASNIGRITALSAGLPEHVPGTTVDRQCGSSQQAVHFAAQAVMSGVQDLVVAGGVEVMSQVPIASPTTIGLEHGMATRAAANGGDGASVTSRSPSFVAPSSSPRSGTSVGRRWSSSPSRATGALWRRRRRAVRR